MGKIALIILGIAGVTAGYINLNGLIAMGYFTGRGAVVGMDEHVQDARGTEAEPVPRLNPILPQR